MSEPYLISCCPTHQREPALRILHAGLAEDGQAGLLHALQAQHGLDESAFDGLLVAQKNEELQAATWVQLLPGQTAVVWPPASGHPASHLLMHAAAKLLDDQKIVLAQILASPDAAIDLPMLAAGEFQRLANLNYLTVDQSHFPQAPPAGNLQFESGAMNDPQRLGNLLLRTYEGSLDCPALNGARRPADIIDGYSGQTAQASEHWSFVRHNGEDVGALIMASHAQGENWELVYMGIVPPARGHRFGWQILQQALWQAHLGEAERMVLAVDEKNEHALRTYRRAGFVVWDRRTIYTRLRG